MPIRPVRIFLSSVLLFGSMSFAALAQNGDVTGSINTAATPSGQPVSQQFQSALDLIEAERFADAYLTARGFSNAIERRAIQWAAIYYGDGDVDFQSVLRFEQDAPDLMSSSLYKTRLEQSLTQSNAGASTVISALGGAMPNTIDAQIMLARAYVAEGQLERGFGIAQQVWVENFLSSEQEDIIAREFAPRLSNQAHWARAVHLLMHDRARGTERIMNYLTPAQKSLALARIAVSRNQSNASSLFERVDPSLRDHPLFHFSRGQFARKQGNLGAAVDYLNQVGSGPLPDAAEWWYERRLIARRLIAANRAQDAYRAVSVYQNGPEGRVVDANLHAGWIALHYLNNPSAAADHFRKMVSLSTLESSITKSNYWLGRALSAMNDNAGASEAFQKAANFPTSYYGILANYRLGNPNVAIRQVSGANISSAAFEQRQIVKIIRLFADAGERKLGEPLVRRLIYSVSQPTDMILTARLAQAINAHNLAVLMADIAQQRGTPMDVFNFPRDGVPTADDLRGIDVAAVYAVARQESKFDYDVVSHAGARGLMQLMPGTAEEVARRIGVSYSPSRLVTDPAYNALLGSSYLATQLSRYDNSLVLAAAAYNAGAGNVNKWINRFGNPSSSGVDPVLWIELIPFAETRNYVQRVVANYLVYRNRLGLNQPDIAKVLRRI